MLQAGIDSGPATPMADTDWDDIRQEVRDRAARVDEILSNNA